MTSLPTVLYLTVHYHYMVCTLVPSVPYRTENVQFYGNYIIMLLPTFEEIALVGQIFPNFSPDLNDKCISILSNPYIMYHSGGQMYITHDTML